MPLSLCQQRIARNGDCTMTLEDGKKLAMLLEDFVPNDFDYKLSRTLRKIFPELNWVTQQQCPVIIWVAHHDAR